MSEKCSWPSSLSIGGFTQARNENERAATSQRSRLLRPNSVATLAKGGDTTFVMLLSVDHPPTARRQPRPEGAAYNVRPMAFPGAADYLDADKLDRNPKLDQAMLAELQPEIHPRSDWAGNRQPTGTILGERDVRFLLVHHTATTNDYLAEEVPDQIRDFYDLHTGPERGWPDVAYNFLIDRYGGVWEARAGSLEAAVRGDATGGSQGFAQLCSLIGNHHQAPPTGEARQSMIALLAWLGHRFRVDTTPGSTVEFASRGSNRWRQGTQVSARTISGHRDMSDTICPGDFAYGMLATAIPEEVTARRKDAWERVLARMTPEDREAATADDTYDPASIGAESTSMSEQPPLSSETGPATVTAQDLAVGDAGEQGAPAEVVVPVAVTAVGATVAGLIALRRRRSN